MAFSHHSDAFDELPDGPDRLAAYGLWTMGGSWMSTHGRTGVLPYAVAGEMCGDALPAVADVLIAGGLWTPVADGYRYDRGPSSDWPMPLWRWDESQPGDPVLTVLRDPDE